MAEPRRSNRNSGGSSGGAGGFDIPPDPLMPASSGALGGAGASAAASGLGLPAASATMSMLSGSDGYTLAFEEPGLPEYPILHQPYPVSWGELNFQLKEAGIYFGQLLGAGFVCLVEVQAEQRERVRATLDLSFFPVWPTARAFFPSLF